MKQTGDLDINKAKFKRKTTILFWPRGQLDLKLVEVQEVGLN